jgi:hypothetical protein
MPARLQRLVQRGAGQLAEGLQIGQGLLTHPSPGTLVARVGCNEPGPFSEGYLDRGTPGSLLMAFSRSENNWVTSTSARKPKSPARGDRHADAGC